MNKSNRSAYKSEQATGSGRPAACASGAAKMDVPAVVGTSTTTQLGPRASQASIENLFIAQVGHFAAQLENWQATSSIEEFINTHWNPYRMADQDFDNGLRVAELLGRLDEDPALRPIWLHSMHTFELAMATVIADRTGRNKTDFDLKLCAATVTAAIRAFDEMMCQPDAIEMEALTLADATKRLAQVIRNASTLSFCDPVEGPTQANWNTD